MQAPANLRRSAYDIPSSAPACVEVYVVFKIRARTDWGEEVVLTGDDDVFGSWDPHRGVRLKTATASYPEWTSMPLRYKVCRGQAPRKYKYAILSKGSIVWEHGDARQIRGSLLEQAGMQRAMLTFDDGEWHERGDRPATPPSYSFPLPAQCDPDFIAVKADLGKEIRTEIWESLQPAIVQSVKDDLCSSFEAAGQLNGGDGELVQKMCDSLRKQIAAELHMNLIKDLRVEMWEKLKPSSLESLKTFMFSSLKSLHAGLRRQVAEEIKNDLAKELRAEMLDGMKPPISESLTADALLHGAPQGDGNMNGSHFVAEMNGRLHHIVGGMKADLAKELRIEIWEVLKPVVLDSFKADVLPAFMSEGAGDDKGGYSFLRSPDLVKQDTFKQVVSELRSSIEDLQNMTEVESLRRQVQESCRRLESLRKQCQTETSSATMQELGKLRKQCNFMEQELRALRNELSDVRDQIVEMDSEGIESHSKDMSSSLAASAPCDCKPERTSHTRSPTAVEETRGERIASHHVPLQTTVAVKAAGALGQIVGAGSLQADDMQRTDLKDMAFAWAGGSMPGECVSQCKLVDPMLTASQAASARSREDCDLVGVAISKRLADVKGSNALPSQADTRGCGRGHAHPVWVPLDASIKDVEGKTSCNPEELRYASKTQAKGEPNDSHMQLAPMAQGVAVGAPELDSVSTALGEASMRHPAPAGFLGKATKKMQQPCFFTSPPHPNDGRSQSITLQLEAEILSSLKLSPEDKSKLMRKMNLRAHPDKGGTHEAYNWLVEWKEAHLQWFLSDQGTVSRAVP